MKSQSNIRACRSNLLCGVPTGWRTLDRDAVADPLRHGIVGMEGLPSAHYLRLTGEIGRLLRGERPVLDELP